MSSIRLSRSSDGEETGKGIPYLLTAFLFMICIFSMLPFRAYASEYNYWSGPELSTADWEMYVEDFDLDGRDDLLFRHKGDPGGSGLAGPDPLFYLAMNSGSSFDPAIAFVIGESTPGITYWDYELYVGDVNGDGYPDIVGREKVAGVARFRVGVFHASCFGGGVADEVPPCWFEDMGDYGWDAMTAPNIRYPDWELMLEDVDGDGRSDLLGRKKMADSDTLFWTGISEMDAGGGFLGGNSGVLGEEAGDSLYYGDWELYPFDYDGVDGVDLLARERSDPTSIKIVPSLLGVFCCTLATFSPSYVGSDSGVYNLDPAHFDLVVEDATGDDRADLVGRQKTWARTKYYVSEQLGSIGAPEFIGDEGDTLSWWNVPSEFTNDGNWAYEYGDFTGDGKLDVLGRGADGWTYYVAESSSDSLKGTRDFLAAEPWRYVAVEGDTELLNANYLDSIYMVTNVIYLKGIECQIGNLRSDANNMIYFRTRDGEEICSVKFSFPVGDLTASPNPIREYANNITLENDSLVMSAKADGSFWFFLKTIDDVVKMYDPVVYDYRKYLQRTHEANSDTTNYIHLNDDMGYGFFTYDVFGSFDGDIEDHYRIQAVDSRDPVFYTKGNAAFIVNVFPAGKEFDKKLLRNRFLSVFPYHNRPDTLYNCEDDLDLALPDSETVALWATLKATNQFQDSVEVGVTALLLFEYIWDFQGGCRAVAPYEPYDSVLVHYPTLEKYIEVYKRIPGIEKIILYVSPWPYYNTLDSRPDSSTAKLFLAEIERLWNIYHENTTEGLGIDGFYLDTYPHSTEYYEEIYTPIRLSYEITRGVRKIIGDDHILFIHSSAGPLGFHGNPQPKYQNEYWKTISAIKEIYAPFLDIYADFVLKGEGGPMLDADTLFIDDDSVYINDHIHYVGWTKNRSNTIGSIISSFPVDPGNNPYIFAFNPIQKNTESPIRPFTSNVESIADLQARYFHQYLDEGEMILWATANRSHTAYRDSTKYFLPQWTDEYGVYETQLFNFWRWLVGPKRLDPLRY